MKFLRTPLSALSLGLLTAGLLHFVLPEAGGTLPTLSARLSAAFGVPTRVERAPAKVAPPAVTRIALAQPKAGPVAGPLVRHETLLLNQPVAVLNGAEQRWTELPKGSSVQIVSTAGDFVQVRQGQDVVTIPRAVLVAGVSRAN